MTKPTYKPWLPAKYDETDAYAIKAVAHGTASADQQKRAIKWIVEDCAHTYDEQYFEESPGNTAYALGSRHVGMQIVKMINLPAVVFAPPAKPKGTK